MFYYPCFGEFKPFNNCNETVSSQYPTNILHFVLCGLGLFHYLYLGLFSNVLHGHRQCVHRRKYLRNLPFIKRRRADTMPTANILRRRPFSCSLSIAIICSSLKRDRFIIISFVDGDVTRKWRKFRGAVTGQMVKHLADFHLRRRAFYDYSWEQFLPCILGVLDQEVVSHKKSYPTSSVSSA